MECYMLNSNMLCNVTQRLELELIIWKDIINGKWTWDLEVVMYVVPLYVMLIEKSRKRSSET
jgi:hypothetical protein